MNHNFVDATPTSNRREGHKKVKVERTTIVAPKVTVRYNTNERMQYAIKDRLSAESRKVLEAFK